MTQPANNFASFMAENVSASRWYLYRLRFLGFFFVMVAILPPVNAFMWFPAGVFVNAFVATLIFSAVFYLSERYGSRYSGPRYEGIKIGLLLVAVVIFGAILFHGIRDNRDVIFTGPNTTIQRR